MLRVLAIRLDSFGTMDAGFERLRRAASLLSLRLTITSTRTLFLVPGFENRKMGVVRGRIGRLSVNCIPNLPAFRRRALS
jgi:hypothetical protein